VVKLTARILPGLITVALGLMATSLSAEPRTGDANAGTDGAGTSRPVAGTVEQRRHQSDDLLLRARRALAENDLDAASRLVSQAEALEVPYSPLEFGDTPRKLRRELEKRQQAVQRLPQSGPLGTGSGAALSDPFAGRSDGAASSMPSDPKSLAKANILNARRELSRGNTAAAAEWYRKAAEQRAVFGPNEDSPERLAADIRRMGGLLDDSPGAVSSRGVTRLPPVEAAGPSSSADLLLDARRALAVGDKHRAAQKVQQAKATGAHFGALDDNPDKVEAAIAAYSDLMAQKSERGAMEPWRRQYARLLLDQADALASWRDFAEAERLASEAARLRVNYSPYEMRPEMVLDRIAAARRQAVSSAAASRDGAAGVVPASGEMVMPAAGPDFDRRAAAAVYDPTADRTQNVLASNRQPEAEPSSSPVSAMTLFQQGETALKAHDGKAALALFREAYARANELDPGTARRLQEYLQLLSATNAAAAGPAAGQSPMLDAVASKQQLLARQLSAEIGHQERAAEKLRQTDPKGAIAALEQARAKVESAGVDQASKDLLIRRIDRALAETKRFAQDNRGKISLDEQNRKTKQEMDQEKQNRLDIQNKIAQKVDEFNTCRNERRFEEMEVVAKQALELDPQSLIAQQLVIESKFIRNYANAMAVRDQKQDGFVRAMESVDIASVPFDDSKPLVFGDAKNWQDLTARRARWAREQGRKLSERELDIQQKLKTPVSVQFENQPLAKVIDQLGRLASVNFYMDPQGLAEQGVSTDTPVTIDLRQEIKLESALNLILQPLHLSYVIKDEVLKVTSEQYKNIQVYTKTYNVADLVIPIPNFVPHGGLGLDGAYKNAMASVNFGAPGRSAPAPPRRWPWSPAVRAGPPAA